MQKEAVEQDTEAKPVACMLVAVQALPLLYDTSPVVSTAPHSIAEETVSSKQDTEVKLAPDLAVVVAQAQLAPELVVVPTKASPVVSTATQVVEAPPTHDTEVRVLPVASTLVNGKEPV